MVNKTPYNPPREFIKVPTPSIALLKTSKKPIKNLSSNILS
jgi:hypothetical protein